MKMLEDKIKEYLIKNLMKPEHELAHDIAEIVEKEKESLDHKALMNIIKKNNKLQQELDEYKLIYKGSYLLHVPGMGFLENPDFWEAINKIANMEEIELYIKQNNIKE